MDTSFDRNLALAVPGRDVLDVRNAFLFRQIHGQKLGELLHALRLAARRQQDLPELQVRHGLGELKAELRIAEFGIAGGGILRDFLELIEAVDGPLPQVGRR